MSTSSIRVRPFGSATASTDANLLDVFIRVPHVVKAADPTVAVLMGRRAAGKTAVALFLERGGEVRFDVVVRFKPKELLSRILSLEDRQDNSRGAPSTAAQLTSLSSDNFVDFWVFAIWHEVICKLSHTESFRTYNDTDLIDIIAQEIESIAEKAEHVLSSQISDQYSRDAALLTVFRMTSEFRSSYTLKAFREMVFAYLSAGHRILVVADTLEDYRVRNELADRALSGLLSAWAGFTGRVNHPNLQVKCFFPAEIYSYLKFEGSFNIRKVEQHTVHLKWTPKQLRTMLSRRMAHWLTLNEPRLAADLRLDERSPSELDRVIWTRVFPRTVTNKQRVEEDTFNYIARHTQLHPGQLIWLCNVIAERSNDEGAFPPKISAPSITTGVSETESRIASSVLAPYSPVYPGIERVLNAALRGCPNVIAHRDFSELYKRALGVWPQNRYSADPFTFERMAVEAGVVGKLQKTTEKYFVTQFEYDTGEDLRFAPEDCYAIHPVFYDLFEIQPAESGHFVCPHVVATDNP